MGRKHKPLQQRVAEGDRSHVGMNKLNEIAASQPRAQRGLGPPPSHMKGAIQREHWNAIAEALELMGLDFACDRTVVEGLVSNFCRAIEADAIVEAEGLTIEEEVFDKSTGSLVGVRRHRHPCIAVANQAWKLTHSFASSLCLTISSRAGISQLIPESPEQAMKELMAMLDSPRTPREPGEPLPDPTKNPVN